MADPDPELRRGPSFDLLALLAYLPAAPLALPLVRARAENEIHVAGSGKVRRERSEVQQKVGDLLPVSELRFLLLPTYRLLTEFEVRT